MLSIDCTFKKLCVSNLHSPRINFRLVFSLSAVYKVKRALSDWSRYYVAVSKSLIFEKGLTFGPLRVLHCVTREKESGKKEMVDDGVVVAVLMSRKGGGHHQNEVVRQTQISRHKLMQGPKVFWKLLHELGWKESTMCYFFQMITGWSTCWA